MMCLNQAEADKLEDLTGHEVKAVITKPRNIQFLRKYFALLKVGLDMCPENYNPEQFRAYVQAGAGWCEFLSDRNGRLIAIPRSISFGKMDEIEFAQLYGAVLDFICDHWALDQDQIEQIVEFM
jgi:hypothetical protein